MITALIVEDERLSAERLQSQLLHLKEDINIVGVCDSVSDAKQWLRDESLPDVIFMDIQLNDGTGFDILHDLKLSCPIIFTTAYDEYAVKAFRFNSIDYLLKPIARENLERAVAKLSSQISTATPSLGEQEITGLERIISGDFKKRFLVKIGEQFKTVNIEDVAYFFFHDGMTYMSTIDGNRWPLDSSLDQLESAVSPLQFFRVNRKLIISLQSIQEIHTYFNSRLLLKLKPSIGFEVIVSRDRVSAFKRWMDL
jgi:two-component system response regulator LytT